MRRVTSRLHAVGAAVVLLALTVGVPVVLVLIAGWPLPARIPEWGDIRRALQQGDIPADVVINTLAVVVWIAWAQLVWALAWELLHNLPRVNRGETVRRAPLVNRQLGAAVARLLAIVLAVGITVASSPASNLARPAAAAGVDGEPPLAPPSAEPVAPRPASESRDNLNRWPVVEGDTLWDIAEVTLGDGGRAPEILELNPRLRSPRDLQPGQLIRLPADATVSDDRRASTSPAAATESHDRFERVLTYQPETVITIRVGDTLWDHCERLLQAAYGAPPPGWLILHYLDEVIAANPETIEEPNLIYPGERFVFPAIGTPPPTREPAMPRPTRDRHAGNGPVEEKAPSPRVAVDDPETPPSPRPSAPTVTARSPQPAGPDITVRSPTIASTDNKKDASADTTSTPWIAGITGATVLASGLLLTYRRLRSRSAAAGATNAGDNERDRARSRARQAIVAASDVPLVRWANHEIAVLAAALKPSHVRGVPQAVEVSETHGLELLWDTPNPTAPSPWEASDGGWAWRLLYDPQLHLPVEPEPIPIPGLVTVGERDGNTVLANLEAFGSIAITGDATQAENLLRSIVLELAVGEDLANSYLLAVDYDAGCTANLGRLRHHTQGSALEEVRARVTDHEQILAKARLQGTFHLRLGGDAIGRELAVVVLRAETAEHLDQLVEASVPNHGVAVVVLGDAHNVGATIHVDATGHAELKPVGVTFQATGIPDTTAHEIAALLDDATQLPVEAERNERVVGDSESEHEPGPVAVVSIPPRSRIRDEEDDDEDDADDNWQPPTPQLLVRVLGVPRVDDHPNLGRIDLNLVTFLACKGGQATEEQVIDAVWNHRAIARGTLWNHISDARRVLDEHFIPQRERESRVVRLAGDVMTDVQVLRALDERAEHLSSTEAIDLLRQGIELVTGVPFHAVGYEWAHELQHHGDASNLVEDVAVRLVDLALDTGDVHTARYAVAQGLRAVPANEPLYRARMRVEARCGNQTGIRAAYNELCAELADLGDATTDYQPDPATTALFEQLTHNQGRRTA